MEPKATTFIESGDYWPFPRWAWFWIFMNICTWHIPTQFHLLIVHILSDCLQMTAMESMYSFPFKIYFSNIKTNQNIAYFCLCVHSIIRSSVQIFQLFGDLGSQESLYFSYNPWQISQWKVFPLEDTNENVTSYYNQLHVSVGGPKTGLGLRPTEATFAWSRSWTATLLRVNKNKNIIITCISRPSWLIVIEKFISQPKPWKKY